jgi:hypothetical protein
MENLVDCRLLLRFQPRQDLIHNLRTPGQPHESLSLATETSTDSI